MDADRAAMPDDIAALKEALAAERAKTLEIAAELAVARAKAAEDSALIAHQNLAHRQARRVRSTAKGPSVPRGWSTSWP